MTFEAIVRDLNTKLTDDTLPLGQLRVFLDSAVDEINTRLNTRFPVFSELSNVTEYTAIPDKYIRTVVIPGAAFKYFIMDEEGSAVAPKYEEDFLKGLYFMERDYMDLIPSEYLEDDRQGSISFENQEDRGLCIDGSVFYL